LLNLVKKGGRVAVIVHVKLARGMVMKKERRELLNNHTLEAVMTMPTQLFYGNQAQPPTCIMVWTAKQPHKGKT
jgi:type I restriction-modification system DNA methylase subunit